MKILILGAGKMGSFFCDLLSFSNDVAIYDPVPERLRFTFNCRRFSALSEVTDFMPDMVLNCATVKFTIPAFEAVLPYIPERCILSDISSIKTSLPDFYAKCGHPFVSSHPMFGPTFASLSNLSNENAIIIKQGDDLGRAFFKQLYSELRLNVVEYTFEEHDETMAYSLSIPFASTLVFAGIMKHQNAPGTTFKRHLDIARGLMSEDDYLLTEILFNPNSPEQISKIQDRLSELKALIDTKDSEGMKTFLDRVRNNIK